MNSLEMRWIGCIVSALLWGSVACQGVWLYRKRENYPARSAGNSLASVPGPDLNLFVVTLFGAVITFLLVFAQ